MTQTAASFLAKSTIKAADLEHRRKINFNIGRYNAVVPQGKLQFSELSLARERAKNLKWRAIETLDQQLEQFELTFTQRGGKSNLGRRYKTGAAGDFKNMQCQELPDGSEKQEYGNRGNKAQ